MGTKDYYEILEVHPKASQEMIEKAYHILARRYHPDMHISSRKDWAHEKFKELAEAYQVLRDPARRRDYDRVGGSAEEMEEGLEVERARNNEEAYFYCRMGKTHYEKMEKRGFWASLFGRKEKDLRESQEDLLEVISSFSTSDYAEEANYYFLVTLMNAYDYSKEHIDKVAKEVDDLLKSYPGSDWEGDVIFELGGFYLLKAGRPHQAREKLEDFIRDYPDHKLVRETRILLELAQDVGRRFCPTCDRKFRFGSDSCSYCKMKT